MQLVARETWDDEVSDLRQAQRKFQTVVLTLTDVLETISDPRAKNRAEDIIGDLGEELDQALTTEGPSQEKYLGAIDVQIKELEKLLAGQRMLFTAAHRVALRFVARVNVNDVPRVFKILRDILDEIAQLLEEIREEKAEAAAAEARRNFKPEFPDIDYSRRPSKPGKPSAPRAKITYARAQNQIMISLDRMGWKISGPLKIPHATSPSGKSRLWFKAQAIYSSEGLRVNDFKSARSTWAGDIRQDGAVDAFLAWAKKLH